MRISDWSSDVCSSDLIAERVRKSGRNVVIVRPVVTAESMITIRQHRAIGPFAVRVELTTNLSASWAAGRVRLDRNNTHVLRGLDTVECAARKAHTGRPAARWHWPHNKNQLRILCWGLETLVRENRVK